MTILITGATSGIGFELAKLYQQTGRHKLVLIGRKALSDIDNSFFNSDNYFQLDLSKPYKEHKALGVFEKLSDFLAEQSIERLDLVIHNAGAALYGPSYLHNNETLQDLINTNLNSPIALSHHILPYIQKQKGKPIIVSPRLSPFLRKPTGKLVFISSVAAHLATPDYAEYVASKAALEGFARSLRAEDDVRVQIIRPGATQTEIFSKAGITTEQVNPDSFPTSEKVAKAIYTKVNTSDLDSTIAVSNKLLSFVGRFFSPILDKVLLLTAKRTSPKK